MSNNEETEHPATSCSTQTFSLTDVQLQALIPNMQQPHLDFQQSHINQLTNIYSHVTKGGDQGNFAKCTSRFDDSKDADVETFIDVIVVYKECSKISDDNALKGLTVLLTGNAATYQQ